MISCMTFIDRLDTLLLLMLNLFLVILEVDTHTDATKKSVDTNFGMISISTRGTFDP